MVVDNLRAAVEDALDGQDAGVTRDQDQHIGTKDPIELKNRRRILVGA